MLRNFFMKTSDRKNINLVALDYLEDKYGEKFSYHSPYGDSMTGTHRLLVTSASFPDRPVLVQIDNYRTDNPVFSDGYLAVKHYSGTVDFLQESANRIFGDANVFYRAALFAQAHNLPATATLDEFLADRTVPLNVWLEVRESNFESKEQAREFAELIAAKGSIFYATIVVVQDSDYGTADFTLLKQKVMQKNFVHCAKLVRLDEIQVYWLEED